MRLRRLVKLFAAGAFTMGYALPTSAIAEDKEETVTPAYSTAVECQNGDITLRGTLQMPAVYNNKKVPMVILSHGFMSSQSELSNLASSLANAGYASVRFDFSGCGVSDGEFIDMTVWTEVNDLNAILDYVMTLDFVDRNNIFLSGNSFGGVVTALLAPDRAKDFNTICLWYPAMCMSDDARSGRIQFTPFDKENIPDSLQVGKYAVSKEFIEIAMALYPQDVAVNYTGDVLIIHGMDDKLVPYTYSVELAEGYKSAELILIEGSGHGFSGEAFDNVVVSMIEYLDRHLVRGADEKVTATN